jgi:hypothetical protein
METTTPKLTKKQRKAIAFRERKGKPVAHQSDVPDPDVADDDVAAVVTTKRKRDQDERASGSPTKKIKKSKPITDHAAESNLTEEAPENPKKSEKSSRYILFVGELTSSSTCNPIQ